MGAGGGGGGSGSGSGSGSPPFPDPPYFFLARPPLVVTEGLEQAIAIYNKNVFFQHSTIK